MAEPPTAASATAGASDQGTAPGWLPRPSELFREESGKSGGKGKPKSAASKAKSKRARTATVDADEMATELMADATEQGSELAGLAEAVPAGRGRRARGRGDAAPAANPKGRGRGNSRRRRSNVGLQPVPLRTKDPATLHVMNITARLLLQVKSQVNNLCGLIYKNIIQDWSNEPSKSAWAQQLNFNFGLEGSPQ